MRMSSQHMPAHGRTREYLPLVLLRFLVDVEEKQIAKWMHSKRTAVSRRRARWSGAFVAVHLGPGLVLHSFCFSSQFGAQFESVENTVPHLYDSFFLPPFRLFQVLVQATGSRSRCQAIAGQFDRGSLIRVPFPLARPHPSSSPFSALLLVGCSPDYPFVCLWRILSCFYAPTPPPPRRFPFNPFIRTKTAVALETR